MLKSTDSFFSRNSMLPVVLALLLALAATVATVEISAGIARQKLQQQADSEAESKANYLNSVVTVSYRSTTWVINSFLSALLTIEYDTKRDNGDSDCRYIMKENVRQSLSMDKLKEMMTSFVNYNYDFHSAVFVFEPGVIADAPLRGFALQVMPESTTIHDLVAEGYNVLNGHFYQRVANSHTMVISSGSVSEAHYWVSTFAAPIYHEDGRYLGQFWVDAEPDYTSGILSRFGSEWDAVAMVLNDSLTIVSSSKPEMNGARLSKTMRLIEDIPTTDEWFKQVCKGVDDDNKKVFRCEANGIPICTYVFPVLAHTYNLVVVQSEDKIYQSVNRFKAWLFIISAIGLIAVLFCVSFIVYAFRRKTISNRRMESELNTASEIQQGILPDNPGPSDLPPSLELYGYQHPAKQVGGDFYDYRIVGDRLYFCIGDVSGKGVPSALVMSQLCSLFRYVSRTETEPRTIVSSINKTVMDHSDDSVMCTFFVGALDLKSGRLDFCNAGHTPPIRISAAGDADGYMNVRPNMPLYAFENWNYVQESVVLQKGDRLVLYTDGVTEAKNMKNCFFGSQATLQSLLDGRGKPFKDMVRGLLDNIKAFAQKARQHDDVTILCIGYLGSKSVNLHFDHLRNDVSGIVGEVLAATGRTDDMRLRLALEEPLQNIADYAFSQEQDGFVDIIVDPVNDAGELSVTLIDNGVPFNPLEVPIPDVSLPVEQRQEGGLGILFTRQIMKKMSYSHEHGRNYLKLTYQTL